MVPQLQLPENFRFRTFDFDRSNNGVGKYMLPVSQVHSVSETWVLQSQVQPTTRTCLVSEATMLSPKVEDRKAGSTPISTKVLASIGKRDLPISVPAQKRRKVAASTLRRRWQEVWAARFSWAKAKFNFNNDLTRVLCRCCTTISGRRRDMVPKADNLEKHEGKRFCKEDRVPFKHLKKGKSFINKEVKHVKFLKLWAGRSQPDIVLDQLAVGLEGDAKRKGVQFSALFQILSHGHHMCNFEREQHLLRHLKVKNLPRKHWSETLGWKMSKFMHASVLGALKFMVQSARVISISTNKVTATDNTSWISVHVCAMENLDQVLHLLYLSCMAKSGTTDHLTKVIMQTLMSEEGLIKEEIACKLVCFGTDGVSTFQGQKAGVTKEICDKWAPFSLGASCAFHWINLVVETLSKYPLVSRLEGLFQSMYFYFCRSNKRHNKLQKLADVLDTKGNNMIRNVETRWISMRSPAKRVLTKYKTLLAKMEVDMYSRLGQRSIAGAGDNFDVLADIEAIKVYQQDLHRLFVDTTTAYKKVDFKVYNLLVTFTFEDILLEWKLVPRD